MLHHITTNSFIRTHPAAHTSHKWMWFRREQNNSQEQKIAQEMSLTLDVGQLNVWLFVSVAPFLKGFVPKPWHCNVERSQLCFDCCTESWRPCCCTQTCFLLQHYDWGSSWLMVEEPSKHILENNSLSNESLVHSVEANSPRSPAKHFVAILIDKPIVPCLAWRSWHSSLWAGAV